MQSISVFGFTLYKLMFYFFIYAFIGWCCEVAYAGVELGKFVNRGFLNGPLCPIYGFGAVIVVVCLTPFKENLFFLFVSSVILTSLLELLAGFILEKLFKTRWWDYSDTPFNIGGYICLKFSLLWGLACVFVMQIVHPAVNSLISIIPSLAGNILLAVFSAIFLTDMILTFVTAAKLTIRIKRLQHIGDAIRKSSDNIGGVISKEAIELKEKYKLLSSKNKLLEKRLLKAFPNMKSIKYSGALDVIKIQLKEKKLNEKKNKK